jgi:AcrR family transcriptional regulator
VHTTITEKLAGRAVERRIAGRRSEYEAEVRRIVDATFALIQRTGSLDPSMRDILAEAEISTQAFYRYFTSKDELMLVLLDEGRRRLIDTLKRRMEKTSSPADRISAWIEGVLAQGSNSAAAARTRPWVLSEQRLTELFPEEQQVSVDALVGLLHDPVDELIFAGTSRRSEDVALSSTLIYRTTFATLRTHLLTESVVPRTETSALVTFCLQGVGCTQRVTGTASTKKAGR